MTDEILQSQSKEHHPLRLIEAESPEEEIMACAEDIKEKIKGGVMASDCAILVPKNVQVRKALEILHGVGIQVSSLDALNLFDQEEAQALLRVLRIISDPGDISSLAFSFFDKVTGIQPLEAHKYISGQNMRKFSFATILESHKTLFGGQCAVEQWIAKLLKWKNDSLDTNVSELVKIIGVELFNRGEGGKLVSSQEILDTILTLTQKEIEKKSDLMLSELVAFFNRLESYGEHVSLVIQPKDGVKILTLHSAKGLEFDYVWIAHMDERSLNSGKHSGFVLPESIAEKVEDQDVDKHKRKLYVAITRAKKFCTISYALYGGRDREQDVAKIISDLPEEVFKKEKVVVGVAKIKMQKNSDISELVKLVKAKYTDRYVSVSLLNNFFECPWKWYFRNLLQLPEAKLESLEFGSAVHEAIDKILKLKKIILPEDKEVAKVVVRWADKRLKDIAENRENEKSVSTKDIKFPHLNIYCKIDLIEYLPANELRVTDFKTGSVRKKGEIEKLDEEGRMSGNLRQLAMYSYLLEQSARKLKVRESRLEFLEAKNKKEIFYDRVITPKEINLLIKDISDYDNLVTNGGWVNRPCNYNSYGKMTVCEYCKMAE